ncbi:MAG: NAD(P)-dependent oxidoreductase, partial [Myxococcales bacterium]|nr:NAD(P)-dependent oxidoreductase [Myxococcales bacterium]
DAAGRAGVSTCVFISSVAVHRPFAYSMGEEDGLATADAYGATKATGEIFLRAAGATHRMTGVVVRPGPIVGPPAFAGGSFRSDHRIADMVSASLAGRSLHAARGEGRQFSDVAAVSRAVVRLTAAANPHPTYLCLDRDIIIWVPVARMVIEAAGSRSQFVPGDEDSSAPVPRFRVERLERLLGGPSDALEALKAHIAHLVTAHAAGG